MHVAAHRSNDRANAIVNRRRTARWYPTLQTFSYLDRYSAFRADATGVAGEVVSAGRTAAHRIGTLAGEPPPDRYRRQNEKEDCQRPERRHEPRSGSPNLRLSRRSDSKTRTALEVKWTSLPLYIRRKLLDERIPLRRPPHWNGRANDGDSPCVKKNNLDAHASIY
jgi:hypothetical protein